MKQKKNINRFLAWMFLVTFMTAYVVKDFHSHRAEHHQSHNTHQGSSTWVDNHCFICDFNFCQSDAPKLQTFSPIITFTIQAPYISTEQTVYREVITIHTHSPPSVA